MYKLNYFDFDDRPDNDDTYERYENRPRTALKEALDYDINMLNDILNKRDLECADKYNIASMFSQCVNEYLNSSQTSKDFEEFLIEVMGKEWYDNMITKWLARKSRKWAKDLNCPELADNKGIYLYNKGADF